MFFEPSPEPNATKASRGKRWLKRKLGRRATAQVIKVSAACRNSKKPFIALKNGVRFCTSSGTKGRVAIGEHPSVEALCQARAEAGLDIVVDAEQDAVDPEVAEWCEQQNVECHALNVWHCMLRPAYAPRTKLYTLIKQLTRHLMVQPTRDTADVPFARSC